MKKTLLKKLANDKQARIEVARNSHRWFFSVYFGHYISYKSPKFQKEMFRITEDEDNKTAVILAFRGSGKSSIFTTSYPIWAILGKQQKKFVVILGQTQRQARQHMANIKRELENNQLLQKDLGPFKEVEDEWGSYSLVIPNYNARITAVSMEQTIRGMRHGQYRPDLILCDDVENTDSVKTKEGRDKIHKWITSEVIPAGDINTKIIFVGNLLHEDSLLMRLKENIQNGNLKGNLLEIPLLDKDDNITWPGKFPDMQAVERERSKLSDEIAWQREYMLKIIPEEGRMIQPEWIRYYDEIKEDDSDEGDYRYILTGVDPAISKKDYADYTAIVSAKVYGYEDKQRIYVFPDPINKRMDFSETLEELRRIYKAFVSPLLIEAYAYQRVLAEQLQTLGFNAEAVDMGGNEKKARLAITSHMIKSGQIRFPRHGAEELINQLVNFGIEKHDDLADALNVLVFKAIKDSEEPCEVEAWSAGSDYSKMHGLSDNNEDYFDDSDA